MLKWYEKKGRNDDVVISSRIRLARNTTQYPFSAKIAVTDAAQLVSDGLTYIQESNYGEIMNSILMKDAGEVRRHSLHEQLVINPYMAGRTDGAVSVSDDEGLSVMFNSEDHIRIQTIISGMDMDACYKAADAMDDLLEERFPYAYSEKFGYHTTFPTNVGTGMRACYRLHLPALANTKKLQLLVGELGRFGVKLGACYGDGVNGMGDIYQISNQRTLGQSEHDIIHNLNSVVVQLIEQERELRHEFVETSRIKAEDEAYKSYGVLKYSRYLTLKNAMILLSEIRMGLNCGTIKFKNGEDFSPYGLMLAIQPRTIQYAIGREKPMSVEEVDIERARIIRESIPELE